VCGWGGGGSGSGSTAATFLLPPLLVDTGELGESGMDTLVDCAECVADATLAMGDANSPSACGWPEPPPLPPVSAQPAAPHANPASVAVVITRAEGRGEGKEGVRVARGSSGSGERQRMGGGRSRFTQWRRQTV